MKSEFINDNDKAKVREENPWACIIIQVDGGCMCFDSFEAFKLWEGRK